MKIMGAGVCVAGWRISRRPTSADLFSIVIGSLGAAVTWRGRLSFPASAYSVSCLGRISAYLITIRMSWLQVNAPNRVGNPDCWICNGCMAPLTGAER